MVEKRVCYVCGAEIGEDENFCPACGADAPPIKVNFSEFIDEEFAANVNASAARSSKAAKAAPERKDAAFDDFFSDADSDPDSHSDNLPGANQGTSDFDPFDDLFAESTGSASSRKTQNPPQQSVSSRQEVSSKEDFFMDENDSFSAPQRSVYSEDRPSNPKEQTSRADPFDDFFSDNADQFPASEAHDGSSYTAEVEPTEFSLDYAEESPAPVSTGREARSNTVRSSNTADADDYGFGYASGESRHTPEAGRFSETPEFDDPFDELIGGDSNSTKRRTGTQKQKKPKKENSSSSNLVVPIVVVSLIVIIALITIIIIILKNPSGPEEPESYSESYVQITSNEQTTPVISNQNRDITDNFSSQQINWLNLFISNFTEACITNISAQSSYEDLIEFAINHAVLNDNDNVLYLGSDRLITNGIAYDKAINADYIRQRIERYFDVSVSPASTRHFLYSNGRYYIPETTPLHSRYYSKVNKITENDDGTITVDYLSFAYNDDTIPGSVYYGLANTSSDLCVGTGSAVLKSKYVGESAANYALVKMYKTDTHNITLQNEENTTSAIQPNSSVPEYWAQYADGLVPENRNYRIELDEDDWNILFRSTPEKIDRGQPGYNVIDKISSGTVVFVDYIYNGKWAAFTYNGQHGFSSIYALNDPSRERIMNPYG